MQQYKLKDFKVSDFQDNYGNFWCEAIFYEVGEPVKWVVKEPSTIILETVYSGEIKEMISKAGKPYNRFYRAKEEDNKQPTAVSKRPEDYEPGVNSRWAIGMAYRAYVQVMGTSEDGKGEFPFDAVYQHAKALVQMFDDIKDGKTSIDSMIKSDVPSGRQKFAEAGEKLKNKISDEPPISDDDFTG